MDNNSDNERFYDFDSEDDDAPTTEELAVWLSDFMSQSSKAEKMYRSHFCSIVVNRLWKEVGVEGMCELMLAIDKRAGWISDIILEDADLHDALFDNHGVFDDDAVIKARMSNRLMEMNKKIWRLRRKYSKLIAEEIVNGVDTNESEDAPKP
jgi:hypothetical protein